MVSERVHLLSLGDEMADVEAQLEPAFAVHKAEGAAGVEALVARHGSAIRAIATRGRDRLDAALLARLPALEIIANYGVGYDSIDAGAAARRGVVVTNTPEVLNDEVADFAVALLLATVRQLPQADRFLRQGKWLEGNFPLGPTLRDRTIGLVGMGRIGERIARRLAAFEVPIVYHCRNARADVPWRHYPDLLAMAKDVDTLLAIVPGGAATKGLIGAAVLRALGPDGIVVNVARGSVVDEPALIEALRSGTILAAGLDVFADEPRVPKALLELDNVVLLPHVGSATRHTRGRMGQLVVDNLRSWFEGRGPLTPVRETPWPRRA
ncbi:MAG TPA: 2-hydroxyacid dehydrogenase [Myxococcales bacterium]|nr:2-hydroxyacid dehydrogenase [Myxococcales bacterium]